MVGVRVRVEAREPYQPVGGGHAEEQQQQLGQPRAVHELQGAPATPLQQMGLQHLE